MAGLANAYREELKSRITAILQAGVAYLLNLPEDETSSADWEIARRAVGWNNERTTRLQALGQGDLFMCALQSSITVLTYMQEYVQSTPEHYEVAKRCNTVDLVNASFTNEDQYNVWAVGILDSLGFRDGSTSMLGPCPTRAAFAQAIDLMHDMTREYLNNRGDVRGV
jgi:hypothetical protein